MTAKGDQDAAHDRDLLVTVAADRCVAASRAEHDAALHTIAKLATID